MQKAIQTLVSGGDLTVEQAAEAARQIMAGQATPAQIGGLLVGLRMKGETADEIVGFAQAMRGAARTVSSDAGDLVDACGTGGDGKGTFNISTVAALVAAGAGCRVAKHGNRWISSRSGSADVLEALGVRVELTPEAATRCLNEVGIAFLFAPLYHEGARHAAAARREIGVRSLFNILGPLCNPAGARRQVIGVFEPGLTRTLCEVLARLGAEHALVVHGADGLDEISCADETMVGELREGVVRSYRVAPEELGLKRSALSMLRGGDAAENARIARALLGGQPGAGRDVVALNAGAVIYVAGRAESLAAGVRVAEQTLESGAALRKLEQLVEFTQRA